MNVLVTYPSSNKMFLLTCKSFDVLFFSQNAPNSYKIELMEKSKLYLCLTIYLLVKLFFLLFSDVYSVCEDLSSTISQHCGNKDLLPYLERMLCLRVLRSSVFY